MTATSELIDAVKAGDRRAMARAITLVESTRDADQDAAEDLLAGLLPLGGKAKRLGISGAPGVGKSTFVETFGLYAIERGHRVAVLAVDPSSTRTGGSILGDKTRMERLSRDARAFIRPSPSAGLLGGIARRTREAIAVVEAAGYDVVIVETVGVGQSETAVADVTDMFLLLLAPGAGDTLQGVKRGVMELADLILVNKADGALKDAARHVVADYRAALGLLKPQSTHWSPRVESCSALEGTDIDTVWQSIEAFWETMTCAGELDARRQEQAKRRLWLEIGDFVMEKVRTDPRTAGLVADLEKDVAAGGLPVRSAARRALEHILI
ncbi:MAG: methylmalonyl Co-A mutase-associated GTPase MeaB [Pseudomonadota bacterium]